MELKLEKSSEEEFEKIAKIYETEFSKPPYNESWTIKMAQNKIKFFAEFYDLYSIKKDDETIGFIVINPNFMCPGEVAFGEEMAIRADMQNKGIGTWTFNEIFKIYKERGFKKFMGIANVESKAFKLYNKIEILPSKKDVLIEKKL